MSSDIRDLYIIREQDASGEGEESVWLAPEPAAEVIVEEILSATDLDRTDVEPLDDHVDPETLRALLTGEAGADDLTFPVDGWTVTVDHDGTVAVAAE